MGTQTFPSNPPPIESDQSVPMDSECSKGEEKGFCGATLYASAPTMEKIPQPVSSYFEGDNPSIHVNSQPPCNKLRSLTVEKTKSLCGKLVGLS